MRRVLVKVGTAVVTDAEGKLALGNLGFLVETVRLAAAACVAAQRRGAQRPDARACSGVLPQLCSLLKDGKEVVLVTSGAIGSGRQRLIQQSMLSSSLRAHVQQQQRKTIMDERACAATGQSALMALYTTLFSEQMVHCSQILVTDDDFRDEGRRRNLRSTIDHLLSLHVVPIINENDVISTRKTPTRDADDNIFWDNDSLACLVAAECQVDLIVLLTDVDGLYAHLPEDGHPGKVIHTFRADSKFNIGAKSRVGRGGMQAKITAAQNAVKRGVKAVVITNGSRPGAIKAVVRGETIGTLFAANPKPDPLETAMECATRARVAARLLCQLPNNARAAIMAQIADALLEQEAAILEANRRDLEAADLVNMPGPLRSRLELSPKKLRDLAAGIRSLAAEADPINKVLRRTLVAEQLELVEETVPLGVVLVVFEARPDALPQIAALALRSGNAVLLKGGAEATHSNTFLCKLVADAVDRATARAVQGCDLVALLHSRTAVDALLELNELIDLVVPRGSTRLVQHIMQKTRIPVLGHAEGICHVYVDEAADIEKAIRVVIDAKKDYPSACNAAETLLLHRKVVESGAANAIIGALRKAKISLLGDPVAAEAFDLPPVSSLRKEYGNLTMAVAVVPDLVAAVDHIHMFGSGHTDAIVTESAENAQRFLNLVDSACVFHNASTRFSDGYRFGLGAEVGISTSKIHARGPVGVEGLTTTKWKLVSEAPAGHIVGDFSSGVLKYQHKHLPLVPHSRL